jgi:hypothetical protein
MAGYWIDETGNPISTGRGGSHDETAIIHFARKTKISPRADDYGEANAALVRASGMYRKDLKEKYLVDDDAINVLTGMYNLNRYMIDKLGWIRVHGYYIEIYTLTEKDLSNLAFGLYQIYGDDIYDSYFNIEVSRANAWYTDVPGSLIMDGSILSFRSYKRNPMFTLHEWKSGFIDSKGNFRQIGNMYLHEDYAEKMIELHHLWEEAEKWCDKNEEGYASFLVVNLDWIQVGPGYFNVKSITKPTLRRIAETARDLYGKLADDQKWEIWEWKNDTFANGIPFDLIESEDVRSIKSIGTKLRG